MVAPLRQFFQLDQYFLGRMRLPLLSSPDDLL